MQNLPAQLTYLFIAEGSSSLKDNMGAASEASQVEGSSRWNDNAADDNGSARSLGLRGS